MTTIPKPVPLHAAVPEEARRSLSELGRLYRAHAHDPLKFGQQLWALKCEYGLTYGYMSMFSGGLQAGTIKQYTMLASALALDLQDDFRAGVLNFKAARAIAFIPDQQRQREVAAAFRHGDIRRSDIEKLAVIVRNSPNVSVAQACAMVSEKDSAPAYAHRPAAAPGRCPRCEGQLVNRPELMSRHWYTSCLQCGYEVVPEPLPLAKNRMGVQ